MRPNYKLAGQFGLATLITIVLGVLVAMIGVWTIGLPADTATHSVPPAHQPAMLFYFIGGLLLLMTVAVLFAAVIESVWDLVMIRKRPGPGASSNGSPAVSVDNSSGIKGPPSVN